MARRCELSGKAVMAGNNVSHSKRRTRRRFLPNLQQTSLLSDVLGCQIRLRITAHALRSVEKHGGLDRFLADADERVLSLKARRLKRQIAKIGAAAVATS